MRILILTQHFPPEIGAAQTRFHGLASGLVSQGHEIHVLTTFPSYPSGVVPPDWRGHVYLKHDDQGIHVQRIWSHAAPNSHFVRRVISNISFAALASAAAPLLPKVDALIVESHPLLNGIAGCMIAAYLRVPVILNVSDLWPENAVQLGVLKNEGLIAFCKRMELMFYRRSTKILAMTSYIREQIAAAGIDADKIVLFRNCVDTSFFCPSLKTTQLRESFGIPQKAFVALYAGTFGLCNDVGTILDTARHCMPIRNIHFVFAGDGAERSRFQEDARRAGLSNVHFVGTVPSERIPELINMSQCAVIALRDLDLLRGTLPRKMFEAMSCGVPVVFAGEGEAKDVLGEANAGICVPAQAPKALSEAIEFLRNHPETCAQMGRSGREYVQQHFDRDVRAAELGALLAGCSFPRTSRKRQSQFGIQDASSTELVEQRQIIPD